MFPPQGIGGIGAVTVTGKRSNTVIVAAYNSLDKSRADYVCDGIDDQETINSAILAISSTGGTVLLLEGTYIITGSINLVSNIALVGQGRGTILKLAENLTGTFHVIYGSEVSGIIISNLKIDGVSAEPNAYIKGIYLDKVTNSKVSTCWFEGGEMYRMTGVDLYYCNNNIIEGNVFYNNGLCISLDNSTHNTIANNIILGGNGGIALHNSEKNTIVGNISKYSPEGIHIEDSKNNIIIGNVLQNPSSGIMILASEKNTIVGNICQECTVGIEMHTSTNNIIEANIIQRNSDGVFLDSNCDKNAIVSNMIQDNVVGIHLARYCNHNIVTGNSLLDNKTGVLLESACSFNLISNNIAKFNADYGIRIESSDCENNVVHGNDLYQNGTDFYDEGTDTIYHNNRTTQGWEP